jgi:hypothetical protein
LGKKGQLISVNLRRITFPDQCPVCGAPATDEGTIAAIPRVDRIKALETYDSPASARPIGPAGPIAPMTPTSWILIPACELHAISLEEVIRFRSLAALCNGILIVLTLFLGPINLIALIAGLPVDPGWLLVIAFMGLMAVVTYYLSGPTTLERAVSVFDIDRNTGFLILKIANPDYAERLLELNPMIAERIGKQ